MARVANWNPNILDEEIFGNAMERLRQCAQIVKAQAVINLKAQIGKGKTTGISHGVYKKGPYAGESWTSRNFGSFRWFCDLRYVHGGLYRRCCN